MASGRPDWFGTIVSAGKYDTTFIPIAVDVNGNIIALIKGDEAGTLRTIAVDSGGIMKANLSVQDLDFLTVRPAYGQARGVVDSKACPNGQTTTLETFAGRGVMLGGWVKWGAAASQKTVELRVDIDGSEIVSLSAAELYVWGITVPGVTPTFVRLFDDDPEVNYVIAVQSGLTFESTIAFKIDNPSGTEATMYYWLYYALVP